VQGVGGGGRASVAVYVLFTFFFLASIPSRFRQLLRSHISYESNPILTHVDPTAQLVSTLAHAQTGDFVFTNLDDGDE
jgi:hypothetical protein